MKISAIECYFDLSYGDTFTEDAKFTGDILINDNGYFEGILSSKNGPQFTFGFFQPRQAINLYEADNNACYLYECYQYEDGKYLGWFQEQNDFLELLKGTCSIKLLPSTKEMESLAEDIEMKKESMHKQALKEYEKLNSQKKQQQIQFLKRIIEGGQKRNGKVCINNRI